MSAVVPPKFPSAASADRWPGLEPVAQIDEGNRNTVWQAVLGGRSVAVRTSRRSAASLAWELDLIEWLGDRSFYVPKVITTIGGERSCDSFVVQEWIDGHAPATVEEWDRVADELQRLHQLGTDIPQRPSCMSVLELNGRSASVDADMSALPEAVAERLLQVFAEFRDVPRALIHGDPAPSNIRITDDGRVGLLDWDESRGDLVWHDLSNLGTRRLHASDHRRAQRLSNAWEATNAWLVEPEYARERLAALDDDPDLGRSPRE
ncbi:MAG: phosphotransferase enzyme family protein [Ilumatobacter sp.]